MFPLSSQIYWIWMIIPYKVTFSADVVPVARMLKILPKLLVLLRDAHATSKVKLVQGNVAATIARMKRTLHSLDQAVLKRADVTAGRVHVVKIHQGRYRPCVVQRWQRKNEVSMCYRRNRMYREVQMPQLRKYDPNRSLHCTGHRKKTKKRNSIQLQEKMWNWIFDKPKCPRDPGTMEIDGNVV